MSTQALLQSLKESILSQASVKAIYGEPIAAHGKTVIPVARIMYGYGAGAGTGGVGDTSARGEGGGGGGGVRGLFPWESLRAWILLINRCTVYSLASPCCVNHGMGISSGDFRFLPSLT